MDLMSQLFEAEARQHELEKALVATRERVGWIKLLMAVISDDRA